MKIFHCDHCQNLIFFENTACVQCGHFLAFLPDREEVAALKPDEGDRWRRVSAGPDGRGYRLCKNYATEKICNWAIPENDTHTFCQSCRLTRVIPDLNAPGHREAWQKLENAKRRLVYGLLHVDLKPVSKEDDPQQGLAFEFLADSHADGKESTPVLTGHDNGVITINIAEADDGEREKRRHQMAEPYRTLLGHFRHEVGHYYWDRLVKDSNHLAGFRELFGDERKDYGQALTDYYKNGPPPDWPQRFISAYAGAHPWEDWAESWAHFFHMNDALETAEGCGLFLMPRRADEPTLRPFSSRVDGDPVSFKHMIDAWFPLTYLLNNLNRGLGLPDGYPFVLSTPALAKLGFIHGVIGQAKPQQARASDQANRAG